MATKILWGAALIAMTAGLAACKGDDDTTDTAGDTDTQTTTSSTTDTTTSSTTDTTTSTTTTTSPVVNPLVRVIHNVAIGMDLADLAVNDSGVALAQLPVGGNTDWVDSFPAGTYSAQFMTPGTTDVIVDVRDIVAASGGAYTVVSFGAADVGMADGLFFEEDHNVPAGTVRAYVVNTNVGYAGLGAVTVNLSEGGTSAGSATYGQAPLVLDVSEGTHTWALDFGMGPVDYTFDLTGLGPTVFISIMPADPTVDADATSLLIYYTGSQAPMVVP